jgi:hypothetical protein
MTCHIMVQSLFLGQTRLGVILTSTDAIAYWQIRAINLDERHWQGGLLFPHSEKLRQAHLRLC